MTIKAIYNARKKPAVGRVFGGSGGREMPSK